MKDNACGEKSLEIASFEFAEVLCSANFVLLHLDLQKSYAQPTLW
jgi:hypothetical protein